MRKVVDLYSECNSILLAFFLCYGGKVLLRWKGGMVSLTMKNNTGQNDLSVNPCNPFNPYEPWHTNLIRIDGLD